VKGGGIERVHQNLADAFSEQGIKSSFFVWSGFAESEEGFALLQEQHSATRPSETASFMSKLNALFATIKSQNISAIIAATETANLVALFCKVRFPKLRVVYTRHCAFDVSDQKLPPWAIKLLYSLYLVNGNVVGVSEALKKQIVASVVWGKNKVHAIPNAVISNKMIELSTRDPNLDMEDEYFIAIGRLVEQKGFDLLLQAYKLALIQNNKLPKLVIAGEGEDEQQLKTQAEELDISHLVHFIGFVSNPYCLIKSAKAFVLSSRHEGMPTVLVEAMALNTPVIAFDCPTGPNELITDGKNGFLIEHLNVTKLADALCDYSSLPRKDLNETVEHFSYPSVARNYAKLCGVSI
jgi:glycosyltransferase involved in cell wall biosynthesis